MKKIVWLFPGVVLSINLCAQQTSVPPPAAAASSEAVAPASVPPAKTEKKKARPAIVEPTVTLLPGKASVTGKNVNVRGQASMNSESIVQLNPGDAVTVIEQINLDRFKPDEPRQWAKIVYPENVDVWVHTSFIDRTNMTVLPARLNLRAGPGENFSVIGVVERGTPIREVLTDAGWTRIAAPAGAYAFIAAMYLQQEAPAAPPVAETPPVAAPQATPESAAVPLAVFEELAATTPAAAPESASAAPAATGLMTMPAPALQSAETAAPAPPPPPRVVTHEGIVKRTGSIQAPTDYQLVNKDTGQSINYLYSPSTKLNLGKYKGLRIVVTGEEGLDSRWPNTPVLTIKRIHVVE